MQTTNTTPEIIDDAPDKVKADLRKFNKAEDQVNKALAALSTVTNIEDQTSLDAALDIIAKAKKVDKIIEEKRVSLVKPYNDEVKRINQCAKDLAAKLPPAIRRASESVLEYNKKLQELKIVQRTQARIKQMQQLGFGPVHEVQLKHSDPIFKLMSHREFDIQISAVTIQTAEEAAWPAMVQKAVDTINEKIEERNRQLMAVKEADAFFGEETAEEVPEPVKPVEAPAVKHVPSFGSQSVKGVTKRWTFSVIDPALVPREYLVVDEAKIRQAMNAGVRDIPGVKFEQTESLTSR